MSLSELHEYVRNLPTEIKQSIRRYTATANLEINNSIRKGTAPFTEMKTLRNLEKAFRDAPYLKETLVVYRGVSKEKYILGDKAYISTSFDKETATDFAKCCLIVITLNPGCLVLPIKSLSESHHEDEVLIDRGHDYKLTRKDRGDEFDTYYLSCLPKEAIKVEPETKVVDIEKILLSAESYLKETYEPEFDDLSLLYKQYRERTGNVLPEKMPSRFTSLFEERE